MSKSTSSGLSKCQTVDDGKGSKPIVSRVFEASESKSLQGSSPSKNLPEGSKVFRNNSKGHIPHGRENNSAQRKSNENIKNFDVAGSNCNFRTTARAVQTKSALPSNHGLPPSPLGQVVNNISCLNLKVENCAVKVLNVMEKKHDGGHGGKSRMEGFTDDRRKGPIRKDHTSNSKAHSNSIPRMRASPESNQFTKGNWNQRNWSPTTEPPEFRHFDRVPQQQIYGHPEFMPVPPHLPPMAHSQMPNTAPSGPFQHFYYPPQFPPYPASPRNFDANPQVDCHPGQYPGHPVNVVPYTTGFEMMPYNTHSQCTPVIPNVDCRMENVPYPLGVAYTEAPCMIPYTSGPMLNVPPPPLSVPPPPLPRLNQQMTMVTIGTDVGPFMASKEAPQFELSLLERSWEGGRPTPEKGIKPAFVPAKSAKQKVILNKNGPIVKDKGDSNFKRTEATNQQPKTTAQSGDKDKPDSSLRMNSSNGKRGPMNPRNKDSPNHIPVAPPDIQEEVIKFICDSWNKVYQEYQRDNSAVSFHADANLPEDFVPFDLDAYWGNRMVQNMSSQNVPTQNL